MAKPSDAIYRPRVGASGTGEARHAIAVPAGSERQRLSQGRTAARLAPLSLLPRKVWWARVAGAYAPLRQEAAAPRVSGRSGETGSNEATPCYVAPTRQGHRSPI